MISIREAQELYKLIGKTQVALSYACVSREVLTDLRRAHELASVILSDVAATDDLYSLQAPEGGYN